MSRQDQYNVTVSLELNGDKMTLGTFDKLTGGEVDSEETRYRPGAMGVEISLGGFVTVGNVTVERLFSQARDLPILGKLMMWAGRADAVAVKQSLDVAGKPVGKPLVYKGTLKSVSPPDADSESSGAALLSMEITSPQVGMS